MAIEAPPRIPEATIGPVEQRELPPAPPLRRIIGPSVILVGVGIASGEYILWPYISSQVGLVFLWAAIVGLLTQYFINMEVERYTLATGETVINRKFMPEPLKIRGVRLAVLAFAFCLFGVMSVLVVINEAAG